jgi:hypothetical protein
MAHTTSPSSASDAAGRCQTGISGLDTILGGGLTRHRTPGDNCSDRAVSNSSNRTTIFPCCNRMPAITNKTQAKMMERISDIEKTRDEASLHILVVEDNLDSQVLVCELLNVLGHRADGVASGEYAKWVSALMCALSACNWRWMQSRMFCNSSISYGFGKENVLLPTFFRTCAP